MKKALFGCIALVAGLAIGAGNFVHDTESVTYQNSGAAITSGQLVDLGGRYGVALTDIPSNGYGTVVIQGVWKFERAVTNAIDAGANLFFSDADTVTDVPAADKYVGQCTEAAKVVTSLTNASGVVIEYVKVDINVPQRKSVVGADVQAYSANLDALASNDGSGLTGLWQVDEAVATDPAEYTPRFIGDVLVGRVAADTGAVWVAVGVTTSDWTQIGEAP